MNSCTFTGRMTRDAEDIGTTGEAVKFTVAVDGYNFSTKSKETTFVPCVAFGKVTTVIKNYAGKGREVGVTATYRVREYVATGGPRQGQTIHDHSFVVDKFELLAGQPAGNKDPNGDTDANPAGW